MRTATMLLLPLRSMTPLRRAHWPLLLTLVAATACTSKDSSSAPAPAPAWLAARAQAEQATLGQSPVIHDFTFVDASQASGLTSFVNRIVEDAGKNYKAVHYDHGTGLCAADVDGDSLVDLYFVTQLGSSELWKNAGGGKFSNVTHTAGLQLDNAIAVGCSFADIDNDGRPDLFVSTVRHGNHLFHNTGGGHFEDISEAAGVAYSGHSSGALFFDYDRDGKLDLLVTNVGVYTTEEKGPGGYYVGLRDAFHGHTDPNRAEASILYHNLGGNKFADVSQETRLVDFSWSGDAVTMDANDDGYPDVYMLDMQGVNHLWLNDAGKQFHDATAQYFPGTPWGAMGAKVFDYNGDGQLDLFITDMHSDMFFDVAADSQAAEVRKADPRHIPPDFLPGGGKNLIFGNALFTRGAGTGAFTDVSDQAGAEMYWPWGPSADDLNADGWDDLFIPGGMSFPFRYSPNSLLLNEAGKKFVAAEFPLGVEPRAPHELLWFTLDCAGADKTHLYCQQCQQPDAQAKGCRKTGENTFTVMGTRSTRSSVLLDVDGDGDLDIVTNEFNAPPRVLLSNLSTKHAVHALKVMLKGTKSNREGLGARVTVVLPDGRRILKVMDGKSGYLSMSDMPLYFGLGSAEAVASIEVKWPSGTQQTVKGPIQSGKLIEITEQ